MGPAQACGLSWLGRGTTKSGAAIFRLQRFGLSLRRFSAGGCPTPARDGGESQLGPSPRALGRKPLERRLRASWGPQGGGYERRSPGPGGALVGPTGVRRSRGKTAHDRGLSHPAVLLTDPGMSAWVLTTCCTRRRSQGPRPRPPSTAAGRGESGGVLLEDLSDSRRRGAGAQRSLCKTAMTCL